MNVGIAKVTLRIPGASSLKDRRRVVRSLVQRVSNRYEVSIVDVGPQDVPKTAVLGFACPSNSVRQAERVRDQIVDFIEADRLDVEIVEVELETLMGL